MVPSTTSSAYGLSGYFSTLPSSITQYLQDLYGPYSQWGSYSTASSSTSQWSSSSSYSSTSSSSSQWSSYFGSGGGLRRRLSSSPSYGSSSVSLGDLCLVGLGGHDMPMVVLGSPFLRSFYSAYDISANRVGLAPATSSRQGPICDADSAFRVPDYPSLATPTQTESTASQATPAPTNLGGTRTHTSTPTTVPSATASAADSLGSSGRAEAPSAGASSKDKSKVGRTKVAAIVALLLCAVAAAAGAAVCFRRRQTKRAFVGVQLQTFAKFEDIKEEEDANDALPWNTEFGSSNLGSGAVI